MTSGFRSLVLCMFCEDLVKNKTSAQNICPSATHKKENTYYFKRNLHHSLIRTLRGSSDDTEYYSHVTLLLLGTTTGLFLGFFTMSCQWIVSAWHRNLFLSTYTPPPRISVGGRKGDVYWSVQCLRIGKDGIDNYFGYRSFPLFHTNLNTHAHAHVH